MKYIKYIFISAFFLLACSPENQEVNKREQEVITENSSRENISDVEKSQENSAGKSSDSTQTDTSETDTSSHELLRKENPAEKNSKDNPEKKETVHEVKNEKGQKTGTVKKIYYDEEAKKILESPIEIYNPIDDPDPTPDPSPSEFVEVDQEPVLLNWEQLKRNIKKPKDVNASGTVYVKVLISKKGFYRGHVIRKSPHPRLSMAVVEQVKKIRAKPAKKDGKPVKVWVNLKYEFK